MVHLRLLLFSLLVALATGLYAQTEGPEIDIRYAEPKEGNEERDYWGFRDEKTGYYVTIWNYPVEVKFLDRSKPDEFNRVRERSFTLKADKAVIWFEPSSDNADNKDAETPDEVFASGVKNVQFYAEGNVLMEYGRDRQSIKLRALQLYLEFTFETEIVKDKAGNPEIDAKTGKPKKRITLKQMKGRATQVKGHSGADDSSGDRPLPVSPGVGIGDAAGEAADPETQGNVGAPPSEDAQPEPRGTPRSLPQERGQRLFVRAKEMKFLIDLQRDYQQVDIDEGSITSSSLAVPSFSVAGTALSLHLSPKRGTAYITEPSVRVLDNPIITLPIENYSYDLSSQFPIRQIELFNTQRFGYGFRTYIDIIAAYDFFVDPEPPFRPLQLGPQVDWYSQRGWAFGLKLDYGGVAPFDHFRRVSMRSLFLNDPGDDRDRARELGWYPVEKHWRGRVLAAYSQYFGAGVQFDHMLNYDTDANFRREFYEPEYDRNDPIDTFFRITKRSGPLNYYLHIEPQVHPWQSKTEYLPTLGFEAMRAPVGDFGLQLSSHTTASILRFAPGDGDQRNPTYNARIDSNTWLSLPFELGPLAIDPFAGARFTLASRFLNIPEGSSRPGLASDGTYPGLRRSDSEEQGYLYRIMPAFGVNAQTFFTGTFPDVRIPALGIQGLRHVFAPFVRYTNVVYNSLDDIPDRAFIPLDEIDVLDEFHEIRIGMRNRLQTRAGRGENRRTVDYFEVMAEIPLYPQRARDNNGRFFGLLELASTWRPTPEFALSGNMFIDIYTGNVERASASARFSYPNFGDIHLYYRLLKHEHQVVGVRLDLTVSESYRIIAKQEYDLETGRFRDTRVELHREILEAFDLGFVFVRDAVDGDFGFYANISATFRAPRGSSSLLR